MRGGAIINSGYRPGSFGFGNSSRSVGGNDSSYDIPRQRESNPIYDVEPETRIDRSFGYEHGLTPAEADEYRQYLANRSKQ